MLRFPASRAFVSPHAGLLAVRCRVLDSEFLRLNGLAFAGVDGTLAILMACPAVARAVVGQEFGLGRYVLSRHG